MSALLNQLATGVKLANYLGNLGGQVLQGTDSKLAGIVTGNTSNTAQDLGSSSGGSTGSTANTATAAQLAEYDQGIGQLEHGLNRLSNQLKIAESNIDKQYGIKDNELTSSYNSGQGQYNTQTTQNQQSRRTNVNTINDQQSAGLRSLLRRLGSIGAVGSDLQLAGRATQDEANALRAGAGQTYAQNQQNLDTNWATFKDDVGQERNKLNDWRTTEKNNAKSQSQTTRQSLLTQLAQLRAQKATAQGLNGADAARADLNSANALSREIDNLAKTNPTYTGKSINYTPRSLDSYSVKGATTVGVSSPTAVGADPTVTMLAGRNTEDEERRQRNMYL